jgi:hypothetical protein
VALKVTGDLGHQARRMARLEHPNVVQVYAEQILKEEQIRLLSMQYVSGATLQTALTRLMESDQSRCGPEPTCCSVWMNMRGLRLNCTRKTMPFVVG